MQQQWKWSGKRKMRSKPAQKLVQATVDEVKTGTNTGVGYCCRVVQTLQKTLMYMFTIYHGPFLYSESIHM